MNLTRKYSRLRVAVPTVKWALVRELISSLNYLTTFNMTHLASYASTPEAKKAVQPWVSYLVQAGQQLGQLDINNQDQVGRNLDGILNWCYQVLPQVDQAFRKYLPESAIPPTLTKSLDLYKKIANQGP